MFVHSLVCDYCQYEEHDITWAVQLTVDRIPALDTAMSRWHGPMNLVIYSKNLEEDIAQVTGHMHTHLGPPDT